MASARTLIQDISTMTSNSPMPPSTPYGVVIQFCAKFRSVKALCPLIAAAISFVPSAYKPVLVRSKTDKELLLKRPVVRPCAKPGPSTIFCQLGQWLRGPWILSERSSCRRAEFLASICPKISPALRVASVLLPIDSLVNDTWMEDMED
jgi:hypothetical protein